MPLRTRSTWLLFGIALFIIIFFWNRNQTAERAAKDDTTGQALVVVRIPDQLSPEAQQGRIAFEKFCAACHGVNAAGQDNVAPPLIHKIYEPSHHGDQSFVLAARRGVPAHHWPFGNMPAIEGISDAEIQSIISYVRELQRANGIQ